LRSRFRAGLRRDGARFTDGLLCDRHGDQAPIGGAPSGL
jgi:hypothetical protein